MVTEGLLDIASETRFSQRLSVTKKIGRLLRVLWESPVVFSTSMSYIFLGSY